MLLMSEVCEHVHRLRRRRATDKRLSWYTELERDTSNRITGMICVGNWVEQVVLCPFGKDDGGTCNSEDTFSVRRYSDQADC